MSDLRDNVIGLVQMLASRDQQLAYERDVPLANVPAELVCMWFDDLYHPDWHRFVQAFSQGERDRLAAFNAFYDARAKSLANSLGEMHRLAKWCEVMADAGRVLDDLGWPAGT